MAVAIYLRFSKQEQATPGAIDSHIYQANKAIKNIGLDPSEAIKYEDRMSGGRFDRPQFQQLLRDIESGKIDIVVVRQDRFSRKSGVFLELSEIIERTKIQLYDTIRQRFIDFNNPDDWSDYQRGGIEAERESRVNSLRIKHRKEYMRVEGKVQGGNAPFGYRRTASGHYELSEYAPKAIRMAEIFVESRSCVDSVRRIYEELDLEWSNPGFLEWLENVTLRGHTPYYAGRDRYGKKRKEPSEIRWNTHPPLLTGQLLKDVDFTLQRNRDRRGAYREVTRRTYALSGLLRCGRCCGTGIIRHITSKKYPTNDYTYIFCSESQKGFGCGGKVGKRRGLNTSYEVAEAKVIEALCDRAAEIIAHGTRTIQEAEPPEILILKQQISQYQEMVKLDPDLSLVLDKKQSQLKALQQQSIERSGTLYYAQERLIEQAKDPLFWELATPEERQVLFYEFVERVNCDGKKIEVKLRV